MHKLSYECEADGAKYSLHLVKVDGTGEAPFQFGDGAANRLITMRDFYMATVPTTRALCALVMDRDRDPSGEPDIPADNLSWHHITDRGGFLDRINAGPIRQAMFSQSSLPTGVFRLPTETEWEYAARGGPHWRDQYRYSGSNDIDAVAWYDRRHGDRSMSVAQKMPNQLGIYDMSGNVWEWCQDVFTRDLSAIPADGTAYQGDGAERVLRGGCFHNWPIHCTVSKRYEIDANFHDGCVGFRLVFACGY